MAITRQKKGSILLIRGIDVSKPAEFIDDHSVVESENFEVTRQLIEKRAGTSELGATVGGTNVEIMGGREFIREGTRYNVRVSREKVEKYNNATSAWDDITAGDLTHTAADLISTAVPLLSGKRILVIRRLHL